MPLTCEKMPTYAYKKVGESRRERLGFCKGDVVEVVGYRKRDGKWVREYERRFPRFKVTQQAKREAREALKLREGLPESRRFGLDKRQASDFKVVSGVERAKQLIKDDSVSFEDAKSMSRFYGRFRNRKGSRAEGAIGLWGGRAYLRSLSSELKKMESS